MRLVVLRDEEVSDAGGRTVEVRIETCDQCGSAIMISDPSAVQKHKAWHTLINNMQRRF